MTGENELPVDNFKKFAQEHGERKKKMKINWHEYVKNLRTGTNKN